MAPQYIDTAEIGRLASRLFDLLEKRGATQVRVEDPRYWAVLPDAREPVKAPSPVMGDVMDDLTDLRAEAAEVAELLVVWHAFNHLAGLIRMIARADMNGDLIIGGRR